METKTDNSDLICRISCLEQFGKLKYDCDHVLYSLDYLKSDEYLIKEVKECFDLQLEATKRAKEFPSPSSTIPQEVTPDSLERILNKGEDLSDIGTNDISNCIVFHAKNYENSVFTNEILERRKAIDLRINKVVRKLFENGKSLEAKVSGHFLYPSDGYMGWHTNSRVVGWRFYINYAEEAGKSFFRYRDPKERKIVTAWDDNWNFRLFRIVRDEDFWHAVYSNTNRFSLGYNINIREQRSFLQKFKKKLLLA